MRALKLTELLILVLLLCLLAGAPVASSEVADYSSIGGQLGGILGPIGAAVGTAVGAIVGFLLGKRRAVRRDSRDHASPRAPSAGDKP